MMVGAAAGSVAHTGYLPGTYPRYCRRAVEYHPQDEELLETDSGKPEVE